MTLRIRTAGRNVLLLTGILAWGCASNGATPPAASTADRHQEEINCELALEELAQMIALRSRQRDFSQAALTEAQEHYALARELYLEREYALAIELIEDGIDLLKEQDH
jgi:hypothetical protein